MCTFIHTLIRQKTDSCVGPFCAWIYGFVCRIFLVKLLLFEEIKSERSFLPQQAVDFNGAFVAIDDILCCG